MEIYVFLKKLEVLIYFSKNTGNYYLGNLQWARAAGFSKRNSVAGMWEFNSWLDHDEQQEWDCWVLES